jgi:FtsZ-interacting cell division protein ZipA
MLPYALAIAVGLSSSILFLTAFFFRDIHRQDDFFWSGVGLFYALVLWFCATSVTGAILLGQLAIVALLTAYFWQMFKLRKAIANPEKKESLDSFSVVGFLQNLFKRSSSPSIAETTAETKIATNNKQIDKTKTDSTPPTLVTTEAANNTSNTNTKPSVAVTTPPTKLNEILDAEPETTAETNLESANNSVRTSSSETEVKPPTSETTESEIKEITVETVRIVEEESNWNDEDDEVDDIPASSIKAIEEVPPIEEEKKKE